MYQAHFGMTDLPFRIAPDLRFYLDTAQDRATIAKLLDGLERGAEFMLLTGDIGAGKTTVVRRMLQEVDRHRVAVGELVSSRLDEDDLPYGIAKALGVPDAEPDDPLPALERFLQDSARRGRRALLVIDEAHGLSTGSLQCLARLTAPRPDTGGVLHVCLVGQHAPPGLEELARLGRPLPIGVVCRLSPLDARQTRDYILHRLRNAGWNGHPAFDAPATDAVHARCGGLRRRINVLCDRILLWQWMEGGTAVTAEVVHKVADQLESEVSGDPAPSPRAAPWFGPEDLEPPSGGRRPPSRSREDASALGPSIGRGSPSPREPGLDINAMLAKLAAEPPGLLRKAREEAMSPPASPSRPPSSTTPPSPSPSPLISPERTASSPAPSPASSRPSPSPSPTFPLPALQRASPPDALELAAPAGEQRRRRSVPAMAMALLVAAAAGLAWGLRSCSDAYVRTPRLASSQPPAKAPAAGTAGAADPRAAPPAPAPPATRDALPTPSAAANPSTRPVQPPPAPATARTALRERDDRAVPSRNAAAVPAPGPAQAPPPPATGSPPPVADAGPTTPLAQAPRTAQDERADAPATPSVQTSACAPGTQAMGLCAPAPQAEPSREPGPPPRASETPPCAPSRAALGLCAAP